MKKITYKINSVTMKYFLKCIGVITLIIGFQNLITAQCSDFGEGDFMDMCVEQMGNGTTGPMTSNILELDGANGMGGDIQLTIESVVCNAGCGVGGPYNIGACIGSLGALGTSSDFAANFNAGASGTPATTCNNAGGYVIVTIDFLNGFNSTAAGFNLAQSSNNGSSEGYEGSFGYVTAGTDASGNPLTLPTINLANFCNYTSANYSGGTSMSAFLGVTGAGTYQTDNLNATAAVCGGGGSQNGEDSGSGSGGTNGTNAASANANLGLAATDIITQVTHVYFYSATPGADCDGDGASGAESNPSGSWSDVDFCFQAPMCPTDVATTTTNAAIVPTESTCQADGVTLDGGEITAATDNCPTGSTLEYALVTTMPFAAPGLMDPAWSTTLPMYNQNNSVAVYTRCLCTTEDPPISSMVGEVITMPGSCCSVTGEISITQVCGELTIEVINITEMGLTGPNVSLDLLDDGTSVQTGMVATGTGSFTFTGTFPNDGSSYSVILTDSGSATCTSTAGPVVSPPDNSPNVPTFVPNGSTTGN